MTFGPLACAAGVVLLAYVGSDASYVVHVLPGMLLFSVGLTMLVAPLTAAVLGAAPDEHAGVASGINSTVRQVGAALGVAVVGSVFASLTISRTVDAVKSAALPASLRDTAAAGVHAQGASFPVPRGTSGADAAALSHALSTGITEAVRPALLLAAGFVLVGAFLSLLLPRTPPVRGEHEPLIESLEVLEPVQPDPAAVLARDI